MWYCKGLPLSGLSDVISKPALRKPVSAARVVWGNQPRVALMLGTSAPHLRLSREINLAFLVVFNAVDIGLWDQTVAGLDVIASFVVLVIMFSFVINHGQVDPGTDQNPECRAENIGHHQEVRRYRQYRSVRQASPVVRAVHDNGEIEKRSDCCAMHIST
jgi:hypothetical protein